MSNLLATKADKFGSLQAPAGEQYWLFFWITGWKTQGRSSARFLLLAQSHSVPSTLSCPEPTSEGDPSGNRSDGRVERGAKPRAHLQNSRIYSWVKTGKPSCSGQKLCADVAWAMVCSFGRSSCRKFSGEKGWEGRTVSMLCMFKNEKKKKKDEKTEGKISRKSDQSGTA